MGGEDGSDSRGRSLGSGPRSGSGMRSVGYRDDDGDDLVGGRGVGGEAELEVHGIKEGCLEAGVGVGEGALGGAHGDGGFDLG